MHIKKEYIFILIVIVGSFILFSQGLNQHGLEYRDDEVFYYQSTQEMIQTGDILSPKYFGEDRFQKPILFYWFILLFYKVLGSSWFAARLVSALFASLTVWVTWLIARKFFNQRVANLSAIILLTMPLFFRHAKTVVPDMAMNFFIVYAIYWLVKVIEDQSVKKYSILFFVSCSLGFMVKGFAALLAPMVTLIIYCMYSKRWILLRDLRFDRGLVIMLFIISPWFLYMIHLHGITYLDYMLAKETQYRLLGPGEGLWIVSKIKSIFEHALFYGGVIMTYFAPWSVFFVLSLAGLFSMAKENNSFYRKNMFLFFWISSMFVFFSFMYFTISHYLLIVTTPIAIMTSFFLVENISNKEKVNSFVNNSVSYFISFIFLVLFLAVTVAFSVLILAPSVGRGMYFFIIPALIILLILFTWLILKRNKTYAAFALALLLVLANTQSARLAQAGVTPHTQLRQFAQTINQDQHQDYVIGVGTHDLHEKEFQVYFDKQVQKVANDSDGFTIFYTTKLFTENKRVYCLISQNDYNKYLKDKGFGELHIVQQKEMFKKNIDINKGFFKAILTGNKGELNKVLKQKVLLVLKESDV